MKRVMFPITFAALAAPLPAAVAEVSHAGHPPQRKRQAESCRAAPRPGDGKPDLSGIWQRSSLKYERNVAADLKTGEIQLWAESLVRQRAEDLQKDSPGIQCLPWGPADNTNARRSKIIQNPGVIVMLNEDLTYRQIFLDGRRLFVAIPVYLVN